MDSDITFGLSTQERSTYLCINCSPFLFEKVWNATWFIPSEQNLNRKEEEEEEEETLCPSHTHIHRCTYHYVQKGSLFGPGISGFKWDQKNPGGECNQWLLVKIARKNFLTINDCYLKCYIAWKDIMLKLLIIEDRHLWVRDEMCIGLV